MPLDLFGVDLQLVCVVFVLFVVVLYRQPHRLEPIDGASSGSAAPLSEELDEQDESSIFMTQDGTQ